jgi:DNA-binding NarL/FixJ family response regulator
VNAVRVLVVDDHPIFRDGLLTALGGVDALVVVGAAEDGEQAVALARDLSPDVVLMDLNMPGIGGIEATRRITSSSDAAVLVLTMQTDDESVFAAVRAGASGYLLKGADRQDVVRSVLAAAAGEALFGKEVARRMLGFLSGDRRPASAPPFPELSAREREILDLMAQGLGNQAIARRLSLAPKTIRNNVSAILAKLQATDRGDAIVRARTSGLGTLPD